MVRSGTKKWTSSVSSRRSRLEQASAGHLSGGFSRTHDFQSESNPTDLQSVVVQLGIAQLGAGGREQALRIPYRPFQAAELIWPAAYPW